MILTLQKLLQKSKQVTDPHKAHSLALDLVESMLRHYAVVAIAAYRHAGARDTKINRILSEQLPRPSMGSWKNFLQMLSAADKSLFPESFWVKFLQPLTMKIPNPDIASAYAGLRRLANQDVFSSHEIHTQAETTPCTPLEFFDAAVSYRNRFWGHGTHEMPDTALQFSTSFLKGTAALCNYLHTLWLAYPVYVAKQAKLYGRTFFRLTPLVQAEGIGELQAAVTGMEEDRLYICFGDKKHPEVESLYPAALWEEEDILFANGTKGLIDIHYIGYASQRSFETSIYEEDFRAFLWPFAPPHLADEAKPSVMSVPVSPVPAQILRVKSRWKLITALIGVILLISIITAGYMIFIHKEDEGITSIAVLPFVDDSPGKDQDYFCEGIAEEIRNTLMIIPNLKVIGRQSCSMFKGKNVSSYEIGRELGVESILEGSLGKEGDNLRIFAKLIKVSDQSQLFSLAYNEKTSETINIKEEIAHSIVNKLRIKVAENEQATFEKRYTNNVEAWSLYQLGRFYWNKRNEESLLNGIEYFEQVIDIDPTYALAYTGIADCYNLLGNSGYKPPREAYSKAKIATEKALDLDDMLAEAHASLGHIKHFFEWDFPGSEKEFKRAREINPNYATGYYWYLINVKGKDKFDEAIAEILRAQQMDPLSVVKNAQVALIYTFARRYTEAKNYYRKAFEIDQNHPIPYWYQGSYFISLKMWGNAIVSYDKYRVLTTGSPISIGYLGFAYAMSGQKDKALQFIRQLEKLSKERYVSPFYYALIFMGLNDKNKAFAYFDKAIEEREPLLVQLNISPIFDSIRDDPRFHDLVKKIGLP